MIIDEVHLLHDIRGPVLEALVSRINLFSLQNLKTIRLIGLSATLPNCEDVGVFLGVKKIIPVPLQQTFFGITEKKPLKQAQMMNVLTFNKVKEASGKQQVLIFVHSRKDTLQTAKFIKEMALEENCLHTFLQNKKASQEILLSESKKFENEELKELIGVGIGIHHAGMSKDDRRLIEDLYADNHLQVLVSTATLAWGVNLPAHTVIIKGTQVYSPEAGHWEELSPMDVMQMIGRAGRPQFDKEGVGIIITTQREIQQLPIESQLITSIVDCLNAEIVIGNIKSIEDGISWLAMTYYYVCMVRSPKLYELRRRDIIHTAASILHKNGLAIYDKRTGRISATELGRVASYYYLTCDTIKAMNDSLHRSATDVDLMRIFSTSSEFKFVSVRETEKPEIQRLLQQVPIPIKEKFDEPTCKINVLLQTYIGRLSLPGFVLSSDTVYVSQNAARIFRSLFELLLIKLWARPAIKALELCKSVARKLFSTQCPLRQIPGASMDICKPQLGELIRLPAKGMALYNTLQAFPRLQLSVISKPVSRSLLHVNITIKAPFNYDHRVHGPSQGYWILVVDTDGEHVLYSQYFLLKQSHYSDPHHISIFVPLLDPLPYNYFVYAISDTYLRCTSTTLLPLSNIVLPTRFAPSSELLNLAPLSTKQFLNTFKLPNNFFDFDVFNPLQTQLYQSLIESNSSVFISSHSGSGKTTLAELAILQYLVMNNKKGAALYIVPFDCERTIVYDEMKKKFNTVVLMENSFEQAKKQIETSQIVICSVHDFEMFTKDWRNDSTLTTLFGLIILDDIQRISEDVEYEIVISRIRIIQKAGNPIRLIGLSLPIADSKSMREWLGVSQTNCYSFKPTSRISPINIRLEVMRQTDYAMRIQAMVQPIIELAFESVNKGKSVAVVVPGRKVMVQVVQEYITLLKRKELISFDENQMICVDQQKEKLLEDNKEVLKDPLLLQALQVGIGILYYAESNEEKYIIKEMFGKKHLSIVFMTFDELEDFRVHCDDGIVMGTTKSERSGIELEMEMLNKFSGCIRNGTLAIYCEPNKKDFISKCLEESQPLESRLVQQEDGKIGLLTHVINNEIVNGVIVDYQSAINYLTNTYFYKRLRCNPSYYGLGARDMTAVSGFLSAFVEEVFNTLKEFQFITINEDEQTITPTETGRIALTTQMDETD
ncbi:U5 small nuclear ribonucleoprotein 200 kDa helicase [Entamoeba marina]